MSQHPDLYVREFLANYLAAHPKQRYRPFAEVLARDKHFQVVNAAKKALAVLSE